MNKQFQPLAASPRLSDERTIKQKIFRVERKQFALALKENGRGRFVRVTETKDNGNRSTIIIPAAGLEGFLNAIGEVLQ